jgi:hypothetical protein
MVLPTWLALNAANDTSPSGLTDIRTGQAYYAGGLNLGDYFDLSDLEANQFAYLANGELYAGRYRRVKVDSGATAANVQTGTIGLMPSLAVVTTFNNGGAKNVPLSIVTSYDQSIGSSTGMRPVVFLNPITPGNCGFVQELGVATVLGKAGLQKAAPAVGDVINSATSGLVDDPTTQTYGPLLLGKAIDLPKSNGLFRILLDLPVVQG